LMKECIGGITIELASRSKATFWMPVSGTNGPESVLCVHTRIETPPIPAMFCFDPSGTVDARIVDSQLAQRMSFLARWRSGCGPPFYADLFPEVRPQFE
jgi:hypothetical protein